MLPEGKAYFDRLQTHLRLGGAEDDVLRELSTHIEDAVDDMVRQGFTPAGASAIAVARLGRPQTLAHLLRQAHVVAPWPDALFAALPMAIASMLVGLRLWQSPAIAASAACVIVSVTLYGLWRGRPAWFYPWAGLALTFPLIAGYLAFSLVQDGPHAYGGSPLEHPLVGFVGGLLYFPIGLLIVSGAALVALRRDWLDASILLSPLPVALAWIVAVHRAGGLRSADASIAETSQVLGVTCICMAIAAVAIMRAHVRSLKIGVLVSAAILLLSTATLASPDVTPVAFVARGAVLVAFLLSPALVAHRLGGT